MTKAIQAKDIPEAEILAAIDTVANTTISSYGTYRTAATWKIQEALPAYPPKVVLARLRSMFQRGVIDCQCKCGCRGDWCRPEFSPWGNRQIKALQAKGTKP